MNQSDSFHEPGISDGEQKPVDQPHQLPPEIHHEQDTDQQHKACQMSSLGASRPCKVSRSQSGPRMSHVHRHRVASSKTSHLKRNTSKGIKTTKPRISRHSNPRARFLCDLPSYNYVLPAGGPLNFTVVEIISILPNWFRSRDLAVRFQNNGISAGVHFLILQEHRHLTLPTDTACDRARDHISDAYRKAMRSIDPTWTKLGHRTSPDFVVTSLLVNNINLDNAQDGTSPATAPIAFKDLAIGMKKLPKGNDAGDLTRALDFAMNNQCDDGFGHQVDFVFPDDIHGILDRVGRAQVGIEHTDPYILARYNDALRQAQQSRYKKHADLRKKQQHDAELSFQMQMVAHQKRYSCLQPALRSEDLMAGQFEENIYHDQYDELDFIFSTQSPFSTPISDSTTSLLPVKRDAQLSVQTNTNESISSVHPITFQSCPYKEASSPVAGRSGSQAAAAIVANIVRQDWIENTVSQRSQDTTHMVNLVTPETSPPILDPVHHLFSAPGSPFFNFVPELNQGSATNTCHESFDADAIAIPKPYSMLYMSNIADSQMDALCRQEDNYALYDELVVPNKNHAFENEVVIADMGTGILSAPRLVDCVQGDDLSDMSEFAHAVRWARSLGGMADDFTVDDIQFVIEAMRAALGEA